jgi:hypothetical protein
VVATSSTTTPSLHSQVVALRENRAWPDDISGAVTLACLLGGTGILVHSLVDFNLQIPANAAWFYVLCAIGASPYRLESRQRVRRVRSLHSGDADDTPSGASEQSSPEID